jgi:hypothetical protein
MDDCHDWQGIWQAVWLAEDGRKLSAEEVGDLGVRSVLAAQAARFAQFFRVCAISRSSASFAESGSIVAFSMARRSTWII